MTDAEIVKACAEARGWEVRFTGPLQFGEFRTHCSGSVDTPAGFWNPLTNKSDALGLLDSLPQDEWFIRIERDRNGWSVRIRDMNSMALQIAGMAFEDSLERACTLAFLRAKGVQV